MTSEADVRPPIATADFTDPRLVAIYDSCNAYPPHSQPRFYRELAAELRVNSIIDLGCGTGLITRELARRGYRVTGVDPAPAMIEIARGRPGSDLVPWIVGDATQLGDLDADLAIMSGHVAQFFLTDADWLLALRALHGALRIGGCLAFESRNPEAREWERWTRQNRAAADDPVAGRVEYWSEVDEVSGTIVSYTNHYLFVATDDEVASRNTLRFRTAEELTVSLTDAGFAIERMYGDWDRSRAGMGKPELIVVARR